MDTTALDSLSWLLRHLQARHVELFIARLSAPARAVCEKAGFEEALGEDHMWHSISQAVKSAGRSIDPTNNEENYEASLSRWGSVDGAQSMGIG